MSQSNYILNLLDIKDKNIKLNENNLFYEENAQALVETIYTKDTIFDNILENQMGHAKCRNEVVCSLLLLLSKKRIVML